MSVGQQRIHRDWEDLGGYVLSRASKLGLEARMSISGSTRLSVRVRLGELEELTQSEPAGASVRLFKDHRSVAGSTSHLTREGLDRLVNRLAPLVDLMDRDEAVGLADTDLLFRPGTDTPGLDLYDPGLEGFPVDQARAMALEAESAGMAVDPRIRNSSGASVGVSSGSQWLATTDGMKGWELYSSLTCSVGLVAEDEKGNRFSDGWWESCRHRQDLANPASIGRIAGRRTADSIGGRPISTGRFPVLFAPETAAALLGHLFDSVSGDAVYKKATFLSEAEGEAVVAEAITVVDDPHKVRGLGSSLYDSEGVATRRRSLISRGKLEFFPCDSYSARRLDRKSTGHASGGGVGSHNLYIEKGPHSLESLLKKLDTGLWATSFIGHGFNRATGDFSRGVRGFWVKNGEIQHPVQEITVSGQLSRMLSDVVAVGSDLAFRRGTDSPSLLVQELTVSGAD